MPPPVTPLPPLDHTPPPLQLQTIRHNTRTTVTILTSPDIYQVQPYVAARNYKDEYLRLDTQPLGDGIWQFGYDTTQVDTVAVAICDLNGNARIAEPRDGSRRFTTQSEFYRCERRNINYLTNARYVRLEKGPSGVAYETSGTLISVFDAQAIVSWTDAKIAATTPTGSSLRTRFRFADNREDLEHTHWSEYYEPHEVVFSEAHTGRFIQCEILLESDGIVTPTLDGFEIFYQFPEAGVFTGMVLF
jgi:hypothetical protein